MPSGILDINLKKCQYPSLYLYQIVTLNMFMIKGNWVYGANFDTLGAGTQNFNSPAKMLKIPVFRPGPPQDVKNFHFFVKNFSLGPFRYFKPLTACPP